MLVPREEGHSRDPLPAPVDPCIPERFLDIILGIEFQTLFFSDGLISEADFIKGEDHIGKGGLRKFSSGFESETLSEGDGSGFSVVDWMMILAHGEEANVVVWKMIERTSCVALRIIEMAIRAARWRSRVRKGT